MSILRTTFFFILTYSLSVPLTHAQNILTKKVNYYESDPLTIDDFTALWKNSKGYVVTKDGQKIKSEFMFTPSVIYDVDAAFRLYEKDEAKQAKGTIIDLDKKKEESKPVETDYPTSELDSAVIGDMVFRAFPDKALVISLKKSDGPNTDLFWLKTKGRISVYARFNALYTDVRRGLLSGLKQKINSLNGTNIMEIYQNQFRQMTDATVKLSVSYHLGKEGSDELLQLSDFGFRKKFLAMISDQPELAQKFENKEKEYREVEKVLNAYNAMYQK